MTLPDTDHYRKALATGDSRRLRERACLHWLATGSRAGLTAARRRGRRAVASRR